MFFNSRARTNRQLNMQLFKKHVKDYSVIKLPTVLVLRPRKSCVTLHMTAHNDVMLFWGESERTSEKVKATNLRIQHCPDCTKYPVTCILTQSMNPYIEVSSPKILYKRFLMSAHNCMFSCSFRYKWTESFAV